MSNPTTPEAINLPDYWQASARVQEILAEVETPDQITGRSRVDFHDAMSVVDEAQRRARAGAETGKTILDNLIASGQLMTPQRLEELAGIEAKLVTDEPVLLQQGFNWRLGILAGSAVYFSWINRHSHFDPIANGYQALPVRSYIELQMNPFARQKSKTQGHKFGTKSIEQTHTLQEPTSMGLPLASTYSLKLPRTHDAPAELLTAWKTYAENHGTLSSNGSRTFSDALLVGRGVVETGLGISLEDVLGFVDNKALRAYVDRPATHSV